MKLIKNSICCCLIIVIIANLILPNLSFAIMDFNQGTVEGLKLVIQDDVKNILKEKITQDQTNNDKNYTQTKQFLTKMNQYIMGEYDGFSETEETGFAIKAVYWANSIQKINTEEGKKESAEKLQELREYIKLRTGRLFWRKV